MKVTLIEKSWPGLTEEAVTECSPLGKLLQLLLRGCKMFFCFCFFSAGGDSSLEVVFIMSAQPISVWM